MRWACVVLCACNQVYDLEPTIARDAQYFDASIDAPFRCPPTGAPLVFSPRLSQLALDCSYYSASTTKNVALAICRDAADVQHLSIGPVDGPLATSGIVTPLPELEISQPQLAFDGDMFLLHTFDLGTVVFEIRVYRDVAGTWVRGGDFPAPTAVTTNPSRAPDRRVVYQLTATDVREMRENADGTWSPGPMHPVSLLGVPNARVMWLSPDALRMLFAVNAVQNPELAYLAFTDRASTADSFGPHTRLELPLVFDPFITEDCSRIYFSGLRSVFYAQQL